MTTVIPKGETGSRKRRLAALEIYQKHLAREEEHFYH